MVPDRVIFTEPPPSLKGIWSRTALAASVVVTAVLIVTLVWRAESWPGSAATRALVAGFGIAFGTRLAARLPIRGQLTAPIVIGAVSSALFFAIFSSATR